MGQMTSGAVGSDDDRPVRRTTRQRVAVLEALDAGDEFVSAQQLHDRLRQRGDSVGLATVYRTLQSLVETGDADSVRSDDGEVRYRRCRQSTHHHHLVCTGCGRTEEIAAVEVEAWATRVAEQYGFSAVHHQVELFGQCADCAARS